jgi:hypothetical protein
VTAYSFQRRFVAPICVGLGIEIPLVPGLRIAAGCGIRPKRQTVRAVGKRRHARPGEVLQLYQGMRTKLCQKIGEARCIDVSGVIIWIDHRAIAIERAKMMLSRREMEQFARDDGFVDAEEMAQFWRCTHKGIERFDGVLIQWEPINGG